MFSKSLQKKISQDRIVEYPEPGRVLLVCGSYRKGGNTETLLKAAAKGAQAAGAEAELILLADCEFRSCIGCERCRKDKICTRFIDGMQVLYPKILASGGLILGSPVYNYNVTARMKAFIDRLYCFYEFETGRPRCWASHLAGQSRAGGALVVGEQEDPADLGVALPALAMPLEALGCSVVKQLGVTGHFAKGSAKGDPDSLRAAENLGRAVAEKCLAHDGSLDG